MTKRKSAVLSSELSRENLFFLSIKLTALDSSYLSARVYFMPSAVKRRKLLFAGDADISGISVTGAQTTSSGSCRSHQTGLNNTSSQSTITVSIFLLNSLRLNAFVIH